MKMALNTTNQSTSAHNVFRPFENEEVEAKLIGPEYLKGDTNKQDFVFFLSHHLSLKIIKFNYFCMACHIGYHCIPT